MNTWSDWEDVIWVIETVSEDMALKQKVFAMLDKNVPPHIPIGSNSSRFSDFKNCSRFT
jgi:3-hydroxybutyryl-CoA dehydrogenase